ncbi:sulfur carrier protein ThiS [Aquimarina sp. W85]|uniref:sulfur carrier protein ThiS n=1 Tax=Aquimarina rhodophyticola TaxID=3342246 RepID=UPI00366F5170
MTITVNNIAQTIKNPSSIRELLQQLSIPETGIAVAQNNRVVGKDQWNTTNIEEKDNITIIQATQGG